MYIYSDLINISILFAYWSSPGIRALRRLSRRAPWTEVRRPVWAIRWLGSCY